MSKTFHNYAAHLSDYSQKYIRRILHQVRKLSPAATGVYHIYPRALCVKVSELAAEFKVPKCDEAPRLHDFPEQKTVKVCREPGFPIRCKKNEWYVLAYVDEPGQGRLLVIPMEDKA